MQPPEIFNALTRNVLGQERILKYVAVAIFKHLQGEPFGNLMLIGSSGTGKTTTMRAMEQLYASREEFERYRNVVIVNANILADAEGQVDTRPLLARLEERARPWDAQWNIRAGTLALSRNLARFDGDEILALAGYNRGTGTVVGWQERGEPIPERARAYAQRVLRAREWFVAAASSGLLAPAKPEAQAVAVR